jgi:prepilin-type N-terminal cleavage/methylation domain-containing protein
VLSRVARRLRGERGFTMVELLVVMATALVILTATTAVIVTMQNHAAGVVTRSDTIAAADVGLREMDQELRQAYDLESPTSTASTSCLPVSSGVQQCNVIDALVRLSGTDFEVRYDCTVPSTTITGDRACWRYLCSASAATDSPSASVSTCTPSSGTHLSSRLVIDDLVNATSADPVFSVSYPSTSEAPCASGASCPTSTTVTIKLPSTGTQATANGGDPSTIVLTDGIYFDNLEYGQ